MSLTDQFAVNYSDKTSLWDVLKAKKVKLIKPEYFISLYEKGLRMPKCQDVPPGAVLDVGDPALDWDRLEIIGVSYCWISKDHPDPSGYHLDTLGHLCRLFLQGSFETTSNEYFQMPGVNFKIAKSDFRNQGYCFGAGDGRPVGVFFDWMSVPQDDRDKIVVPKYRETFRAVIADAEELRFSNLGFGDAEAREVMALIRTHGQVRSLDLGRNKDITVPLDEWATLCSDLQLTQLHLNSCYQVSGDIRVLNSAGKLETLHLGGTQVSGDLQVFEGLRGTKCLKLNHTKVSGDIQVLQSLRDLDHLNLRDTAVTGDIQVLRSFLGNLTQMRLSNTMISGDIEALNSFVNLTVLRMSNTQVKGDIFALRSQSKLRDLDLSATQVHGDVQVLLSLGALVEVNISNTQITGDKEALRLALPQGHVAL